MLVFFGYGRCESVRPVDFRRMTEAVDLRGDVGREVAAPIHPRLIGGGAQGVTSPSIVSRARMQPLRALTGATPVPINYYILY